MYSRLVGHVEHQPRDLIGRAAGFSDNRNDICERAIKLLDKVCR